MSNMDNASILAQAREGIESYLKEAKASERIDEQLYKDAMKSTFPNLENWMNDPNIDKLSPSLKQGIINSIKNKEWNNLVNAFRQYTRFGTGGIRSMMAFDYNSIVKLKEEGLDAAILKGPATINNIVLLLTSAGVAKFGNDKKLNKIVIGYDSRIRGFDLASIVAQLFLAYGYTVYFFDEPCPYPEVTFAIPMLKADMGILISASHNDYRYNGYKLSCGNGSQFDPAERDIMYNNYIAPGKISTSDIKLLSFKDASSDKLWFLGGDTLVDKSQFDYGGKEANLINLHEKHRNHVKSFLMTDNLAEQQNSTSHPLNIGYCAYHGAGRVAVPRLLKEVGFKTIWPITANGLNDLNGLFPSFNSKPGFEQQPDPGDPRAALIAVNAFKEQYGSKFDEMDILIGTDPDADRCGVVVKVPKDQQQLYENRDWTLMSADDLWSLVIWYRLQKEIEKYGQIQNQDKKFITMSHTTSDSITLLAKKYGIGMLKTWVGFAALSAGTRDIWNGDYKKYVHLEEGRDTKDSDLCNMFVQSAIGMDNGKRSINIGAMEQSNGFSILGGPPLDPSSLGTEGHVRDKDGTFAAFLIAEIAAWAKAKGKSLFELMDENIYLDPEIGLFVNGYEPDPMDGEYPGIEGDRLKKFILRRALAYFQFALAGDLYIAGMHVKSACIYRTGKYDKTYPPTYDFLFPDEGIRFYFDEQLLNHVTIRPSGTGNSLRFHTQLRQVVTKDNIKDKKAELHNKTKAIFADLRDKLKAPK